MSDLQLFFDVVMVILWSTTYTLVLIDTIKYRYPLIPPMTQVIIFSLEFSVLLSLMKNGGFTWNYVAVAYSYWCAIEVAIFGVEVIKRYISKKWIVLSAVLFALVMIPTIYGIIIWKNVLLFCYINTFTGIVTWFIFVLARKDYPMNGMTLTIFILKMLGDICPVIVYFTQGDWVVKTLVLLLPICHSFFLGLYILRRRKNAKKRTQSEQTIQ